MGRHWGFRVPTPRYLSSNRLPLAGLVARGEAFAERWLPEPYRSQGDRLVLLSTTAEPYSDGGLWLHWVVCHEGLQLPVQVHVGVRQWDGRVSFFGFGETLPTVPTEPRIDAEHAEQAALAALARRGMTRLRRRSVERVIQPDEQGKQRHEYVFNFEEAGDPGASPPDVVSAAWACVDALTGEVRRASPYEVSRARFEYVLAGRPYRPDAGELANDESPCWLRGGLSGRLVTSSHRSRPGSPIWGDSGHSLFVVDPATGAMHCPLQALEDSYEDPSAGGDLVAAGHYIFDGIVLVNLVTGRIIRATEGRDNGYRPALSPDGRLLAFVASSGTDQENICAADVDAGGIVGRRWLARLDGKNDHPVFSPDGRWVYWGRVPPTEAHPGGDCELWRASPIHSYWEGVPPQRILDGLGRIERLSVFPDGKRILVWHLDGLEVVDVEAKSRQRLTVPDLRDPDFPSYAPLRVTDICVSPDGKRLAFAGSLWRDTESPWGRFLYVCNLDFSGLRRVTPAEDVLVPPFRWLGSGRPAFKVLEDTPLYSPKRAP